MCCLLCVMYYCYPINQIPQKQSLFQSDLMKTFFCLRNCSTAEAPDGNFPCKVILAIKQGQNGNFQSFSWAFCLCQHLWKKKCFGASVDSLLHLQIHVTQSDCLWLFNTEQRVTQILVHERVLLYLSAPQCNTAMLPQDGGNHSERMTFEGILFFSQGSLKVIIQHHRIIDILELNTVCPGSLQVMGFVAKHVLHTWL